MVQFQSLNGKFLEIKKNVLTLIMNVVRNWLEKAYKVLEDKEKQLANLNKVSGKADDIKEFVSDVMTHGADLKFLSISGQKFVSLSKVKVTLKFRLFVFFVKVFFLLHFLIFKNMFYSILDPAKFAYT